MGASPAPGLPDRRSRRRRVTARQPLNGFYGEPWQSRDARIVIWHGNRITFLSRKRRSLGHLFRNKRRRVDRFWKRAELARYLPERLFLLSAQCKA